MPTFAESSVPVDSRDIFGHGNEAAGYGMDIELTERLKSWAMDAGVLMIPASQRRLREG